MSPPLADERFEIVEVRLRELEPVPAAQPFRDATMGPFTAYPLRAVGLRDRDGTWGEAPLKGEGQPALVSLLVGALLAHPPAAHPELLRALRWAIRNDGFRGPAGVALAAVDLALHDLAARRRGLPLHRLLGATRDHAPAYGSGGGTHLDDDALAAELAGFVARGFGCVKMKVAGEAGTRMDDDVRRVRLARAAIGPGVELAVDANQAWSVEEALRFAERIADQDVAWFEEPVHSADLVAIGELARRSPVPLAFGESERCRQVFPSLVAAGVRHLQPMPEACTAVEDWLAVRDLAARSGCRLSCGGVSYLTCQLVATAGAEALTELLVPLIEPLAAVLADPPRLVDGRFELGDAPGLACRVDWERCAGRVRSERSWSR